MKTNKMVVANGAFTIGRVTRQNTIQGVQPSTRAASSISLGTSSKKVIISQNANGSVTMPYMSESPHHVSMRLRYAHMIITGIMTASGGNKRSCRIDSGKFWPTLKRETPYAASVPTTTALIVPRVAHTRLEIAGPTATRSMATRSLGAWPVKMKIKLSNVGSFGSQDNWSMPEVHSSRGLKAIVAIQKTGTIAMSDAKPTKRYRPAPRKTLDRFMRIQSPCDEQRYR